MSRPLSKSDRHICAAFWLRLGHWSWHCTAGLDNGCHCSGCNVARSMKCPGLLCVLRIVSFPVSQTTSLRHLLAHDRGRKAEEKIKIKVTNLSRWTGQEQRSSSEMLLRFEAVQDGTKLRRSQNGVQLCLLVSSYSVVSL